MDENLLNINYSHNDIDEVVREQRLAYQTLLNNVLMSNKLLSNETEEEDILMLLLSITRLIVDFRAGAVFKFESGKYNQISAMDADETFFATRDTYLDEGIYTWAYNQKRVVVMPEGKDNTHIIVPITTEEANIGILDLQVTLDADLIKSQDLDLLWVVVNNASSRCEQVKLNRWSGLLDILLSNLEKINSSEELDSLFDLLLKGLDQIIKCTKYLLLIKDNSHLKIKSRLDDGESYCIPISYNNGKSCSFVKQSIEKNSILKISNYSNSSACETCEFAKKRPKSDSYLMIVPLKFKNEENHGAITIVDSSYDSKLFNEDTQNIVKIFANQVAIAIHQTKLRDELQHKNEKINKEIQMASVVQQSLLPPSIKELKINNHGKVRVHIDDDNSILTGFYLPCSSLGGDFYDIYDTPDFTYLTIADVSGHGISSSLITSLFKMALHRSLSDPSVTTTDKLCYYLNKDLCKFIKTGDYITAFIAKVDKSSKTIMFSSAGHPYPVYYNAQAESFELIEANGLPLAMFERSEYPVKEIKLNTNDKILFYTDGILESINDQAALFGKTRLVESCETHLKKSSSAFLKSIYQDVESFTGTTETTDDITMLLFESK